ncbi:hypothetical protein P6F26_16645, partial [Roseibacterium sp. SDUM158017]|uniref:hypothetical protein n=1 Tax=Roseicyclus salinarum TaxID=3036773 RepID=UPI0024157615
MLQHLRTVLRLGPGEAQPLLLFGDAAGAEALSALSAMRGDRPNARKLGGALLVVAPAAPDIWTGWIFAQLPAVTDLPDLISRVAGLSRVMVATEGAAPSAAASPETADAVAFLAGRFATAGRLRRRGVLQTMADAIPEAGLAAGGAAFPVSARRSGRPSVSDRDLETATDEIRALAERLRRSGGTRLAARADDLREDGLDAALVLKSVGREAMILDVPPAGEAGLGLVLYDPAPGADAAIAPLRDLGHLAMRRRRG